MNIAKLSIGNIDKVLLKINNVDVDITQLNEEDYARVMKFFTKLTTIYSLYKQLVVIEEVYNA